MGLRTKGVLAQGMDADINIFDPAQIHTRATYQDPAQFSDGLDTVFVSGQPAILHGALTGRTVGFRPKAELLELIDGIKD